ncbi:MAG: hypothetical protein ABI867_37200 [Kofleriaceae bacterium]
MVRIALCLVALVACSSTYHAVKLVNRTDRTIEAIYIFPTGAADHGSSRGSLAPNATSTVKVKAGNVDVLAVSAKIKIDDRVNETRTATQTLELKKPLELVFHDSTQTPPGLERPDTVGVTFRAPAAPKPADEPPPEP